MPSPEVTLAAASRSNKENNETAVVKYECLHCGAFHAPGSARQRSWFVGAFGRWFGGTLSCAPTVPPVRRAEGQTMQEALLLDGKKLGVLEMKACESAVTCE